MDKALFEEYTKLLKKYRKALRDIEDNKDIDDATAYGIMDLYAYRFSELCTKMANVIDDLEDTLETYKAIHIG